MKRTIFGLTAFGLLLLLAAPARGQRTVEPSFFGMHVKSPAVLARMPVRFGTLGPMPGSAWKWLEPQPGQWNWGGLDAWVAAAGRQGYDIVYTFLRTPAWAGPSQTSPPSDLNTQEPCAPPAEGAGDCMFKSFVTALVSRYKGKIRYYQVWNEPNSSGFWTGSPADLVRMAHDAYIIVHRIDPQARVLTPATSPSGYPNPHTQWLAAYLRAGGAQYADIGSWHGYLQATTYTAPWPEHAESATPGCSVGTWRCPGSVLDSYRQIRQVMDANGMAGKELWDTEGSWGVNDARHSNLPDPDDQSAWLARWFILQAGAGVNRAIWYMFDATDGWGTLWDQGAGLHPAGVAYQQVYGWLVGATISPCVQSRKVWSCELSRPGGYQGRIVWSDADSVPYPVTAPFTQARDLTGKPQPVSGASLILGKSPLLLENRKDVR